MTPSPRIQAEIFIDNDEIFNHVSGVAVELVMSVVWAISLVQAEESPGDESF